MVCPPITVVRGTDSGSKVNVELPIMTTEEPGPTAIVEITGSGAEVGLPPGCRVVLGNPTPPGPIEIVWPLATVVVGGTPGVTVNVKPPTTTTEEPTATVTPSTTVGVGLPAGLPVTGAPALGAGRSTVVPGPTT